MFARNEKDWIPWGCTTFAVLKIMGPFRLIIGNLRHLIFGGTKMGP